MGSSPTVPETNRSDGFVDGLRVHFPILRHQKKKRSEKNLKNFEFVKFKNLNRIYDISKIDKSIKLCGIKNKYITIDRCLHCQRKK